MRAITFSTLKVSRTTRAAMMLELSPLLTAANAAASLIPASIRVPVEPDPGDLLTVEVVAEPPERLRLAVDDGNRVPVQFQAVGQGRPDPSATHDHNVHGRPPESRPRTTIRRYTPASLGRGAVRSPLCRGWGS